MSFRPRRARLQFTLSTLFLLLTCISVWLGIESNRIRRQAQLVKEIYDNGGIVVYDYQMRGGYWNDHPTLPGNVVLRALFGNNYAAKVIQVEICAGPRMSPQKISDETAARLAGLTEVWWFALQDTSITDSGLRYFHNHPNLKRIDLTGSKVTTSGAEALHKALPKCVISYGDLSDFELIDPLTQ